MKKFIFLIVLLVPSSAFAEELLPAICEQVLDPKPETSIVEIIGNHIGDKLKTVPSALAADAQEFLDQAAESLAETIESKKPALAAGVLGASDVYDPTLWETIYSTLLSALAFMVRHWVWTLGAVTVFIVGYSFRP